jgi:serine phosphatase RsbU (regulator of sigma subunit)
MMPGMRDEEQAASIATTEMVLLYSDGLVEAHNAQRAMFGVPRLRDRASAHAARDSVDLIALLLAHLQQVTDAGCEQEDDITPVVLQRWAVPVSVAS